MLSQNDARPCSSSSNLMKMHFFIQVANDSKSINTGGNMLVLFIPCVHHTMHATSKYKTCRKELKCLWLSKFWSRASVSKNVSLYKKRQHPHRKKGLLSISVKFVCPPFITSFNQSKSKVHRRDEREGKVKECVIYLCSPITTTRGIFFLDLESVHEFKPFPAKKS